MNVCICVCLHKQMDLMKWINENVVEADNYPHYQVYNIIVYVLECLILVAD